VNVNQEIYEVGGTRAHPSPASPIRLHCDAVKQRSEAAKSGGKSRVIRRHIKKLSRYENMPVRITVRMSVSVSVCISIADFTCGIGGFTEFGHACGLFLGGSYCVLV